MQFRTGPNNMSSSKPVPMKLFSSWEVDRTPSNCIPRLCSLTLTRLTVIRPLPMNEVTSLSIAVKMVGSRRTLRSNEIPISENGLINTDLDLHFSLQYPHFLKRDENRLLVMLQRRKRYKNRTILGYKTLAEGSIDLAFVLQRCYLNLELCLNAPDSASKDHSNNSPLARVTVTGISSHPIDDLESERKSKRGKRRQVTHDESEEEDDYSSQSSDSPPDDMMLQKNPKNIPNKNLKQKIVNLLRKFKANEEAGRQGRNETKNISPVADIDELFDELDGLSDSQSEPDADMISLGSCPRPMLPPFFASSKSLVQQQEKTNLTSDEKVDTDSCSEKEQQSGESPKMTSRSSAVAPAPLVPQAPTQIENPLSKSVGSISEQLSKAIPLTEEGVPELVAFVWMEGRGCNLYESLCRTSMKALAICSLDDCCTAFHHLVAKVQKFCHNNSKTPHPIIIVVVGTETLLSSVSKSYVKHLSSRQHDWQSYFSFIFAPLNVGGSIWKTLCSSDPCYEKVFKEYNDRNEDVSASLKAYLSAVSERRKILALPIAEAMITSKENDESSQVFVPFICEARLSVGNSAAYLLDCPQSSFTLSAEPAADPSSSPPSPPHTMREEPLELQIDFWKGTVKSTIKAIFITLVIQRTIDNSLSLSYVIKEKKQKIMRLGKKKEKDSDAKTSSLDGISRLVCLARSHNPMKLYVDGMEWPAVKFFQVSSQWQSQVKTLPMLVSAHCKVDS